MKGQFTQIHMGTVSTATIEKLFPLRSVDYNLNVIFKAVSTTKSQINHIYHICTVYKISQYVKYCERLCVGIFDTTTFKVHGRLK